MSEQHYFPPLKGPVDCAQCEAADCWCRNMHQRSRRDFTHTSGRCPRLPDLRGFVERDQREAYAAAFMLIHAELGAGGLQLTLTIPGQKRYRKVYLTKSGYWYFNTRSTEGDPIRQALNIGCFRSKEEIVQYMEKLHYDYCIFRCELADFLV